MARTRTGGNASTMGPASNTSRNGRMRGARSTSAIRPGTCSRSPRATSGRGSRPASGALQPDRAPVGDAGARPAERGPSGAPPRRAAAPNGEALAKRARLDLPRLDDPRLLVVAKDVDGAQLRRGYAVRAPRGVDRDDPALPRLVVGDEVKRPAHRLRPRAAQRDDLPCLHAAREVGRGEPGQRPGEVVVERLPRAGGLGEQDPD